MSTRYSFDKSAIDAFERKFKVGINLNHNQENNLDNKGSTSLTCEQLSQILFDLFPTEKSIAGFIEEALTGLSPIVLTLYVLNDATWELMQKKPEFHDRMLPMITIPWFYWSEVAESAVNPRGIQRHECGISHIAINLESKELTISGEGGDFSGIVEDRVAQKKIEGRPLFIPGWVESKKSVIHYEFKHLDVRISLQKLNTDLYPMPDSMLDYGFSESPKVFLKHGIKLYSDGANFQLKVGSRPRTKLAGEVLIYIGKSLKSIKQSYETILFHLWLNALEKISTSR